MTDWKDLLLGVEWEGVDDEYGPSSHVIVSAFELLSQIEWFESVGEPVPDYASTKQVNSWDEAIRPLIVNENQEYGPNGHLTVPSERCISVIEADLFREWWQKSGDDGSEYCHFEPYIPKTLDRSQKDFIEEYVYEFVSFLLAEIIGTQVVGTTYFREMLSWFAAGHFPCGWIGSWPAGMMRVY